MWKDSATVFRSSVILPKQTGAVAMLPVFRVKGYAMAPVLKWDVVWNKKPMKKKKVNRAMELSLHSMGQITNSTWHTIYQSNDKDLFRGFININNGNMDRNHVLIARKLLVLTYCCNIIGDWFGARDFQEDMKKREEKTMFIRKYMLLFTIYDLFVIL